MPTPAQLYEDVLWESARLEPNELLVCLCHAKHAYRDGLPVDFSWVTTDRLMECTKLSRGAVVKARKNAIAKGWLTDIGPRRGHSQIRNYRLTIPHGDGPASAEPRLRNAEGRFAKKETGPRGEPVHDTDRSRSDPQVRESPVRTGPQMEPVHDVDGNRSTDGTETGPPRGPESLTESLTESLSPAGELTVRLTADHHATAEEVSAVLAAAARDGIRSLPAWSRSDAGREDFARRLVELRAEPPPRRRSACGHSDVIDPFSGSCLICDTKAKRAALPVRGSATSLGGAEAHARLAELLARGRAARERRERRKAARRRSVQSAEVFDPTLWGRREDALRRAQWCWPESTDGRGVGSVLEDTADTAGHADHEGRALSESGTR